MQEPYSLSPVYFPETPNIEYFRGRLEAALPELEKQLKELDEAQRIDRSALEIQFTI